MIHKFSIDGENVVLDVNSGAVHIFDDLSFALLSCIAEDNGADSSISGNIGDGVDDGIRGEAGGGVNGGVNGEAGGGVDSGINGGADIGAVRFSQIPKALTKEYEKKDIDEAAEEIRQLISEGLLFCGDQNDEEIVAIEMTHVFKSLCLHMAHDCNMRCGYCFASNGSFGLRKELMSFDIAKKSIDFVVEFSKDRRNLEIDFFGGEPLLNFDVIQKTVDYARERELESGKKFRFTLTTNGLLLGDRNIDYINQNMDNIVLSLDGRMEVNDKMRKLLDGRGSYNVVLPRFKKIVNKRGGKNYYIRGTYTALNKDFMEDVLHLADLGFDQISVEPVVTPEDKSLRFDAADVDYLKNQYEALAREYKKRIAAGNGFNFFHFMVDLSHGPCLSRRITGCGAGYEYAAVTPSGDIYPCHQFVGRNDMRIGSVYTGITRDDTVNMFKKANVYNMDKCKTCWAKFHCSGGCAANAFAINGSIFEPGDIYCELVKKRLECAFWIGATL
ncbi:MAG: thioether cross-link-forming SCIFF peptide maturase [Oscillospiraceae bacterium]|nr:thioether cross-link-forming SCIFF peptide maturase [Oscillospiraceae bacterium]